jgi:hypothetical protein
MASPGNVLVRGCTSCSNVADPEPGTGAFLTHGSGKWVKIQDPDPV